MAVKIKLTRLGKIRNPQYRIAVADARTRRDGRSIEVIGRYHPKEDPSLIEIDSERAQYWLGVGAQPTEAVLAAAEDHRRLAEVQGSARRRGHAEGQGAQAQQVGSVQRCAGCQADGGPTGEATAPKKKKAPAKKAAEKAEAEAPPRHRPRPLRR